MRRLLIKPGRTEIGALAISMIETWSAAIDYLGNVDFLEIVRQAIVECLQSIDLALEAIELREPLAQIERLRFPFLDIRLQVFHLLADGVSTRGELLDRVGPE